MPHPNEPEGKQAKNSEFNVTTNVGTVFYTPIPPALIRNIRAGRIGPNGELRKGA